MVSTTFTQYAALTLFVISYFFGAAFATHLHTSDAADSAVASQFAAYAKRHGRTYTGGEYAERMKIYEQRIASVLEQNARTDKLWTATVNKFTDRTDEELKEYRGWSRHAARGARSGSGSSTMFFQEKIRTVDGQFTIEGKDYSNLSSSKYIRNQGSCGSCWAIATATVLSAHYELATGTPRAYSAQEILSCTQNPQQCGGEGHCKGATAELAMEYVLQHGCADESSRPYHAVDGTCSTEGSSGSLVARKTTAFMGFDDAPVTSLNSLGMTGWRRLPENKGDALKQALVEKGPAAVSVAGSDWFNYDSGVFDGCSKDAIVDHAVVLVAYGNGKLRIQNSWGKDWGEGGYINLLDTAEGEYCGIDNKPELGTACKGQTDPVKVCGMCGVYYDSVIPEFGSS